VSLTAPKWEKQDANNCGPASLALYLRHYGWEGDQFTISEEIKPFREDRNVNIEELAYYARNRAGWLNFEYRVGGDLETLKQILAAGLPVMIESGIRLDQSYWPNDDQWAAHYLLLTGYDETNQTFTGQDTYFGADKKIPYAKLDKDWQAFNRVYIMLYPPDQEPTIKSILGEQWDVEFNRQHALQAAQTETQKDPLDAFAWFNLGTNLAYFERYIDATEAFDRARNIGLPQRMLRYQFSPFMAYFHSGQLDDLNELLGYALKITRNSEEAFLWRGWMSYRQGDRVQAIEDFRRAIQANPNYEDAKYALEFVGAAP
jgi:tetratricopeptide (TPR) repeat protein